MVLAMEVAAMATGARSDMEEKTERKRTSHLIWSIWKHVYARLARNGSAAEGRCGCKNLSVVVLLIWQFSCN